MECVEYKDKKYYYNSAYDLLSQLKADDVLDDLREDLQETNNTNLLNDFNVLTSVLGLNDVYQNYVSQTLPVISKEPEAFTKEFVENKKKIFNVFERLLGFIVLKYSIRNWYTKSQKTNEEINEIEKELDDLHKLLYTAMVFNSKDAVEKYGVGLYKFFDKYGLEGLLAYTPFPDMNKSKGVLGSILFSDLKTLHDYVYIYSKENTSLLKTLQLAITYFGDSYAEDNMIFNRFIRNEAVDEVVDVVEEDEELLEMSGDDISDKLYDRSNSASFERDIPLELRIILATIPLNTEQLAEPYFVYKSFFNHTKDIFELTDAIVYFSKIPSMIRKSYDRLMSKKEANREEKIEQRALEVRNYLTIFAKIVNVFGTVIPVETDADGNKHLVLDNINPDVARHIAKVYEGMISKKTDNFYSPKLDLSIDESDYEVNIKVSDSTIRGIELSYNRGIMVDEMLVNYAKVIRDKINWIISNDGYSLDNIMDVAVMIGTILRNGNFGKLNINATSIAQMIRDKGTLGKWANYLGYIADEITKYKSGKGSEIKLGLNRYEDIRKTKLGALVYEIYAIERWYNTAEAHNIQDPGLRSKSNIFNLGNAVFRNIYLLMQAYINREFGNNMYASLYENPNQRVSLMDVFADMYEEIDSMNPMSSIIINNIRTIRKNNNIAKNQEFSLLIKQPSSVTINRYTGSSVNLTLQQVDKIYLQLFHFFSNFFGHFQTAVFGTSKFSLNLVTTTNIQNPLPYAATFIYNKDKMVPTMSSFLYGFSFGSASVGHMIKYYDIYKSIERFSKEGIFSTNLKNKNEKLEKYISEKHDNEKYDKRKIIKDLLEFLVTYLREAPFSGIYGINNPVLPTGPISLAIIKEFFNIVKNRVLVKILENTDVLEQDNTGSIDIENLKKNGTKFLYLEKYYDMLSNEDKQIIEDYINSYVDTTLDLMAEVDENGKYTLKDKSIATYKDITKRIVSVLRNSVMLKFINSGMDVNSLDAYLTKKNKTFDIERAKDYVYHIYNMLIIFNKFSNAILDGMFADTSKDVSELVKTLHNIDKANVDKNNKSKYAVIYFFNKIFKQIAQNEFVSYLYTRLDQNGYNSGRNTIADIYLKRIYDKVYPGKIKGDEAKPFFAYLLSGAIPDGVKEEMKKYASEFLDDIKNKPELFKDFNMEFFDWLPYLRDSSYSSEIIDFVITLLNVRMAASLNNILAAVDMPSYMGDVYSMKKEEAYKRLRALVSPGESKWTHPFIHQLRRSRYDYSGGGYMSDIINKNTINTGIINDNSVNLNDVFSEIGEQDSFIREIHNRLSGNTLNKYDKIEFTDGEGYVHLDVYKMFLEKDGKWTINHQKAYSLIIKMREMLRDGINESNIDTFRAYQMELQALGLQHKLFNVYKPQSAGYTINNINNEPHIHKNSLLPVIPELYFDINGRNDIYNFMYGLREVMENNKIHILTYGSSNKLSKQEVINKKYNHTKDVVFINDKGNQEVKRDAVPVSVYNVNLIYFKLNSPDKLEHKDTVPINIKLKIFSVYGKLVIDNMSYDDVRFIAGNPNMSVSVIERWEDMKKQEIDKKIKVLEDSFVSFVGENADKFYKQTGIPIVNGETDNEAFYNYVNNIVKYSGVNDVNNVLAILDNPILSNIDPFVENLLSGLSKQIQKIAQGTSTGNNSVVVSPMNKQLIKYIPNKGKKVNKRISFTKTPPHNHIVTDKNLDISSVIEADRVMYVVELVRDKINVDGNTYSKDDIVNILEKNKSILDKKVNELDKSGIEYKLIKGWFEDTNVNPLYVDNMKVSDVLKKLSKNEYKVYKVSNLYGKYILGKDLSDVEDIGLYINQSFGKALYKSPMLFDNKLYYLSKAGDENVNVNELKINRRSIFDIDLSYYSGEDQQKTDEWQEGKTNDIPILKALNNASVRAIRVSANVYNSILVEKRLMSGSESKEDIYDGIIITRAANTFHIIINKENKNAVNKWNKMRKNNEQLAVHLLVDMLIDENKDLYNAYLKELGLAEGDYSDFAKDIMANKIWEMIKERKAQTHTEVLLMKKVKEIIKRLINMIRETFKLKGNREWIFNVIREKNNNRAYMTKVADIPALIDLNTLVDLIHYDFIRIKYNEPVSIKYKEPDIIVSEESNVQSYTPVYITMSPQFSELLYLKHKDGGIIGTVDRLNEMLEDKEFYEKYILKHYVFVSHRVPLQDLGFINLSAPIRFFNPATGNIINMPAITYPLSGMDNDFDKQTNLIKVNQVTIEKKNIDSITIKGKTFGKDVINDIIDKFNALPYNSHKKAMFMLEKINDVYVSDILDALLRNGNIDVKLSEVSRYSKNNALIDSIINVYSDDILFHRKLDKLNNMDIVVSIANRIEGKKKKYLLDFLSASNIVKASYDFGFTGKALGGTVYLLNLAQIYAALDVIAMSVDPSKSRDEKIAEYEKLEKQWNDIKGWFGIEKRTELLFELYDLDFFDVLDSFLTSYVDIQKDDSVAKLGYISDRRYQPFFYAVISTLISQQKSKGEYDPDMIVKQLINGYNWMYNHIEKYSALSSKLVNIKEQGDNPVNLIRRFSDGIVNYMFEQLSTSLQTYKKLDNIVSTYNSSVFKKRKPSVFSVDNVGTFLKPVTFAHFKNKFEGYLIGRVFLNKPKILNEIISSTLFTSKNLFIDSNVLSDKVRTNIISIFVGNPIEKNNKRGKYYTLTKYIYDILTSSKDALDMNEEQKKVFEDALTILTDNYGSYMKTDAGKLWARNVLHRAAFGDMSKNKNTSDKINVLFRFMILDRIFSAYKREQMIDFSIFPIYDVLSITNAVRYIISKGPLDMILKLHSEDIREIESYLESLNMDIKEAKDTTTDIVSVYPDPRIKIFKVKVGKEDVVKAKVDETTEGVNADDVISLLMDMAMNPNISFKDFIANNDVLESLGSNNFYTIIPVDKEYNTFGFEKYFDFKAMENEYMVAQYKNISDFRINKDITEEQYKKLILLLKAVNDNFIKLNFVSRFINNYFTITQKTC